MAFSQQDEQFMRQALELARRGTGLTSPGARVGAVIVDSHGNFVGSGFYTFEGTKHAEILALEQAGSRARGAHPQPGHTRRRQPSAAGLVALRHAA